MEHRLPIAVRWTLYALGAVEGQRVRRPRDPVAAWILRRHPKLHPTFAAPTILAMLRARADRLDDLVIAEARRAEAAGRPLTMTTVGGGFDARWFRLRAELGQGVARHVEIEDPEVLGFKDRLLTTSTFAGFWQDVERAPMGEADWAPVVGGGGRDELYLLEGVAVRLGVEGIRAMLERLRERAPHATVIVDLPGIVQPQTLSGRATAVVAGRSRWTSATVTGAACLRTKELQRMGYRVIDDEWHAARPELRAPSGLFACAGVEALRVLRLRPQ
jgi:hypothetical protein